MSFTPVFSPGSKSLTHIAYSLATSERFFSIYITKFLLICFSFQLKHLWRFQRSRPCKLKCKCNQMSKNDAQLCIARQKDNYQDQCCSKNVYSPFLPYSVLFFVPVQSIIFSFHWIKEFPNHTGIII